MNTIDQEQQTILDISDSWSKAIVANDANRIADFMADDWMLISEHGVMTKNDFLTLVSTGQLAHEAMDMAELGGIHIYGDTAVMASRVKSVAIFGGQRFPANEWTSDVFVRQDGEWKCVKTHLTPVLGREAN